MKLKNMLIDGEVQQVPDIKVGDRVQISMEDREDVDLFDWLNEHEGEPLIVSTVEYDTFMIWLHGCEYGISMHLVSDVFSGVDAMLTVDEGGKL